VETNEKAFWDVFYDAVASYSEHLGALGFIWFNLVTLFPLPNYQTIKLPNYQTTKLSKFRADN
jgi:hypothetical protein